MSFELGLISTPFAKYFHFEIILICNIDQEMLNALKNSREIIILLFVALNYMELPA